MVLSFKGKEFYYIFKTEGDVLHGYKILRYLSQMHSFSEYDESQVFTFTEDVIENERYFCKARSRKVQSYRILGKVVEIKDSEIKLIV